ncbi:nucleotide-binding protein [gut metagenome]|uniref:tRNA threonylcarbamoyladenosine biosynthesis protein TsaE n=1 Tax=gut metagenome TaxID=749906 RepID=J9FVJ3_9ZZZZ
MDEFSLSFDLPHPDDTDKLGALFAGFIADNQAILAREGLTVHLDGNLGAGKTSFVRATLRALHFQGPVKSPTFSLVETYPIGQLTVNHFDFYRFEDPMEFEDAGFRDFFGPGFVTFTEWTDKAQPYVPTADIVIELTHVGLGRHARLSALSDLGCTVLTDIQKRHA